MRVLPAREVRGVRRPGRRPRRARRGCGLRGQRRDQYPDRLPLHAALPRAARHARGRAGSHRRGRRGLRHHGAGRHAGAGRAQGRRACAAGTGAGATRRSRAPRIRPPGGRSPAGRGRRWPSGCASNSSRMWAWWACPTRASPPSWPQCRARGPRSRTTRLRRCTPTWASCAWTSGGRWS